MREAADNALPGCESQCGVMEICFDDRFGAP
jgi:hypothetical protein